MTSRERVESPPLLLVVEDDDEMRMMLRRMMERVGYDVIEARNGEEGVQLYRLAQPTLTLLDVMMPVLDGVEAARRMRDLDGEGWTPILMLTARDRVEDRVRGLDAGADDFLAKPFNGSELVARVRALVRLKSVHDRLLDRQPSAPEPGGGEPSTVIRTVLSQRMAPHQVARLTSSADAPDMTGVRARVTLLHVTLDGFEIFRKQHGARRVFQTLNLIWDRLVPLVLEFGGTFDRFDGGRMRAFFGAPLPGDDDAANAVECALRMKARYEELVRSRASMDGLAIGIAFVTDTVLVGNAGSSRLVDYTLLGDAVGRVQQLADRAGSELLLCEETARRVAMVRPIRRYVPAAGSPPLPESPVYVPGPPEDATETSQDLPSP